MIAANTPDALSALTESLNADIRQLSALESDYHHHNHGHHRDNDGWHPIGDGMGDDIGEMDLGALRSEARELAAMNEYAINGHENRISYVIGTGHTYTAVAKKDTGATDDQVAAVQAAIDAFTKRNRWARRQQETLRRVDRDGEAFLRFFTVDKGLIVRFVEPWQVSTPDELSAEPNASMGILVDDDDIETPIGYFVDDELVDASDIQHRKQGVDENQKRGVPLMFAVFEKLRRIEKISECIAIVAQIQAKFALIRKHSGQNSTNVQAILAAKKVGSSMDALTGATHNVEQYPPGAIIDVPQGTEYEFPTQGLDAARYVTLISYLLRGVASRLIMPEFMLTSDASNANFASTFVSEGPAVKNFQRLQSLQREDDLEVIELAVNVAGVDLTNIEIQVGFPSLTARDRLAEAQEAQIYIQMQILSPQTLSGKLDLDYEQEQANISKHRSSDLGFEDVPQPGAGDLTPQEPEGDGDGDQDDGDEETDSGSESDS